MAEEGPALTAGVEAGDVIVALDGAPVDGLEALYRGLWAKGEAGVRVTLDVLRGSDRLSLTVVTSDRYTWLRSTGAR